MGKRRSESSCSPREIKMNCTRYYETIVKKPSNINPIFLEKHYDLEVGKK